MESASNKLTIKYHDIFDYPLTSEELKKWKAGLKFPISNFQFLINEKQNFHFIKGRQKIIETRLQNEKYSKKKLEIANRAVSLISKISTVLFVGITGSLAMNNASKNSDIDLLIVTKQNTLWTTRLIVYFVLRTMNYVLRRPRVEDERDALCLNMWLDETDLDWAKKDRNIYTAHEIAQVVPLVNKDNTYEKFLYLNKWILDYWPNSIQYKKIKIKKQIYKSNIKSYSLVYILSLISRSLELILYRLQYLYMKNKITIEVVTPTRAIFHPNDWGKIIFKKLSS